jgi:hypothetical protein
MHILRVIAYARSRILYKSYNFIYKGNNGFHGCFSPQSLDFTWILAETVNGCRMVSTVSTHAKSTVATVAMVYA